MKLMMFVNQLRRKILISPVYKKDIPLIYMKTKKKAYLLRLSEDKMEKLKEEAKEKDLTFSAFLKIKIFNEVV